MGRIEINAWVSDVHLQGGHSDLAIDCLARLMLFGCLAHHPPVYMVTLYDAAPSLITFCSPVDEIVCFVCRFKGAAL